MAEFIPAAAPNFKVGRDGNAIRFVIIHTVVGTQNSAIATFQNPTRIASAHYIVDKTTPRVVQMVQEQDTAYHAGNFTINEQSIGIEHADDGDYNGTRPDILYATSAALVADLCRRYNIPCTRDFIKRHNEVSLKPTACPDALDIDRIVRQANDILNPPAPPQPEWRVNLRALATPYTRIIQQDISLLNFDDGSRVKFFPKGSEITVHYGTSVKGVFYYMTQSSVDGNRPTGFVMTDFDYVEPTTSTTSSTSTTSTTSSSSSSSTTTSQTPPPDDTLWNDIVIAFRALLELLKKWFKQ